MACVFAVAHGHPETLKGRSRPAWSKRQMRDFIMHDRDGDARRTG